MSIFPYDEESAAGFVENMVEGARMAHRLVRLERHHVLLREDYLTVKNSQVAIISGGGSGHEPAHAGFVGPGMLTAAVCGGVFASPTIQAVLDTILTVTERAKASGLDVRMVVVGDDAALNDEDTITGRRGLAGTLFVHKVAGSAAAAGGSLDQVELEASKTAKSVASMGVALTTCTIPGSEQSDRLAADMMEVGLGIHGEPGLSLEKRKPLQQVIERLVEQIYSSGIFSSAKEHSRRTCLMVNSLGGTPLSELYIALNFAVAELKKKYGATVERVYVGFLMTSMQASGLMLTIHQFEDNLRLARLDANTEAPAWPKSVPTRPLGDDTFLVKIPEGVATKLSSNEIPNSIVPLASTSVLGKIIEAACESLISSEQKLCDLDKILGDGDCGTTMKRGATAVLKSLREGKLSTNESELCTEIADILGFSCGGTSGAILQIIFNGASAAFSSSSSVTWGAAMSSGAAAATSYGGAGTGDRTLLDALIPACEAKDLKSAAKLAEEGAQKTGNMRARAGRSSYIPFEQTVGHADPGACAISIAISAMASAE